MNNFPTPNNEKTKASPEERVDKMNGIFDRLVLPMILFTLAMIVAFGVIPKLGSCVRCSPAEQPPSATDTQPQQPDAYDVFAAMPAVISDYPQVLEAAGYTVTTTEGSDSPVAYRQLESGAEIIENLRSNGTAYSVIYRTDPATGIETNIMIYDRSLFLVMLSAEGQPDVSAIFDNDSFAAEVSAADGGQAEVLALVPSEQLCALMEEYKSSVLEVLAELKKDE